MIRHVFRPTVGFSWCQSLITIMWVITAAGFLVSSDYNSIDYNYFQARFGTSSNVRQGYVNLSVNNNVEMKVASSKDSSGFRKISLYRQFGGQHQL